MEKEQVKMSYLQALQKKATTQPGVTNKPGRAGQSRFVKTDIGEEKETANDDFDKRWNRLSPKARARINEKFEARLKQEEQGTETVSKTHQRNETVKLENQKRKLLETQKAKEEAEVKATQTAKAKVAKERFELDNKIQADVDTWLQTEELYEVEQKQRVEEYIEDGNVSLDKRTGEVIEKDLDKVEKFKEQIRQEHAINQRWALMKLARKVYSTTEGTDEERNEKTTDILVDDYGIPLQKVFTIIK